MPRNAYPSRQTMANNSSPARNPGAAKPWSRPVGPANDNVPKPANDNRKAAAAAVREQRRLKNATRALRGVYGLAVGAAYYEMFNTLTQMAAGRSIEVLDPNLREQARNFYTALPLHVLWEAGPPGLVDLEGAPDSRQTGQATSPPWKMVQNVPGPGWYVSTWKIRRQPVAPFAFRKDELATYGPSTAAGPGLRNTPRPVTDPFVTNTPIPVTWTWPDKTPWPLVPLDVAVNPNIQGGYGPSPSPAPPRPQPSTDLPWVPRGPPGPGRKERKLKANPQLGTLLRVLGKLTEIADLMDAFYDALPKEFKVKHEWKKVDGKWTKARVTEAEKAKALYQHWDKVDLAQGIFNAMWDNLIADRAWAMLGLDTRAMGRLQGSNMGANKLLGESHGDALRDLLTGAKQFTAQELGQLFGLDLKG